MSRSNLLGFAGLSSVGLILMLATACRPSPQCYTSAECGEEQMCVVGQCVVADSGVIGTLEPSWYEVIYPIIQQRCWGGGNCHVRPLPPGIPMALEEYVDTQQPSRQGNFVYQEMAIRVQDLVMPMPPRGQSQLGSQQIRFFVRWNELGAPLGDPAKAPDGGVNNGMLDAGITNTGPLATVPAPTEVQTGFFSLSGPAWGNANGILVTTDRAQDTIFFASPPAPPQVLLRPSSETVGVASDAQGNIILAQYLTRQVARIVGTAVVPITDRFNGLRYNGPHDLIGTAGGSIYFTDPDFGLGARSRELTVNGLYRISPDGATVTEVWSGIDGNGPAGLELSPDESKLYMTDRVANSVLRFDIAQDGTLQAETLFASTLPSPDGITVDAMGNVYVATEFGVQGFSPQGVDYGLLPLPVAATGLVFGDSRLTTLYVTTPTTLYSFQMPNPGVAR